MPWSCFFLRVLKGDLDLLGRLLAAPVGLALGWKGLHENEKRFTEFRSAIFGPAVKKSSGAERL